MSSRVPKSNSAKQSETGGTRQFTSDSRSDQSQKLVPSHIMQLQRTIGNRAVAQLLQSHAAPDRRQSKENASGLPDRLKSGLEQLSGVDLSDVQVHRNSGKPAEIGALAYAQGTDIHIGPGQEKHLPHEGWHVVQQKRGRVQPTLQLKDGLAVNDDSELEREADEMGEKALALGATASSPPPPPPEDEGSAVAPASGAGTSGVVQGVIQRAVQHDAPNYQQKGGRAGKVSVENIRGKSLGAGANSPSVDVFGWPELMNDGHTLANPNANNSHYNAVRMHLWNGRLGGPGNDPNNLAPGPATTNSSMSAGPETAAKDAVDSGYRIWLETEVWYQNSSGQRNDYTSVIPNRMKMEWGYMSMSGGRGPAEPPQWDETIDQPAGALTAHQQGQYQALTTTGALDNMLLTASNQEKAQAYSIVAPALQKHMLLNYSVIYYGMQDDDREDALYTLDEDEIGTLIGTLNIGNNHIALYFDVLVHLFDAPIILQGVFGNLNAGLQKKLLQYAGWELVEALDDVGLEKAKEERYVFSLMPEAKRYDLLDQMSANEIAELLGNKADNQLFEAWARARGNATADELGQYIQPRVTANMFLSFNKNCLKWLKMKENSGRNRPY